MSRKLLVIERLHVPSQGRAHVDFGGKRGRHCYHSLFAPVAQEYAVTPLYVPDTPDHVGKKTLDLGTSVIPRFAILSLRGCPILEK